MRCSYYNSGISESNHSLLFTYSFSSFLSSFSSHPDEKTEQHWSGEMCHHTEHDTFKLEPIIEVSLVPFLLDAEGRGGDGRMWVCLCVCVSSHLWVPKYYQQKWGHFGWYSQLQKIVWGLRPGFNVEVRTGFMLVMVRKLVGMVRVALEAG